MVWPVIEGIRCGCTKSTQLNSRNADEVDIRTERTNCRSFAVLVLEISDSQAVQAETRLQDLLYYTLVGAFFTHELDAVKRHEWRVLPALSSLPERTAEQTFIWLHVPLFALLLWGGEGDPASTTRIALAAFAIVHVGLHVLFRRHPAYEFNNLSSWGLILLTGLLGVIYLFSLVGT